MVCEPRRSARNRFVPARHPSRVTRHHHPGLAERVIIAGGIAGYISFMLACMMIGPVAIVAGGVTFLASFTALSVWVWWARLRMRPPRARVVHRRARSEPR